MHHAQNLQKIFPVAEGDHAQGPSCSVEREYCPHSLKSHIPQLRLAACGGKRRRERARGGGRPPPLALSLPWGGVGNTLDDELTMPGERVLSMHIIDQLLQCHQLKTTLL